MKLIIQPDESPRLGDFLCEHLNDPAFDELRAAVAFAKCSGIRHLVSSLPAFASRGHVQISVGVDFGGTTAEGLKALIDCVGPENEIWVYHNESGPTFHPKLYLFKGPEGRADIAIGSGNLTEGGIFTNYEAAVVLSLDLASEDDAQLLAQAESALDQWCNPESGLAQLVDLALIRSLLKEGYIFTEKQARKMQRAKTRPRRAARGRKARRRSLFASVTPTKAPRAPRWGIPLPSATPASEPPERPERTPTADVTGFLMTLQKTDVGVGQTSAGTSRRSPEVFIPLAARNHAPDFWGWPEEFTPDAAKPGKMDRPGVKMWLGTTVIEVNMMTWPDKHDFRLRCEALRSAGSIGDILRLERAEDSVGFEYTASVIPQGTVEHRHLLALCINRASGKSKKLWGYY